MSRKTDHATAEDHALVTAAIAEAELSTSGEIVTIVADQSDHYQDIAAIWATITLFLALTCYALLPEFYLDVIHFMTGGWEHEYSVGEYLGLVFVALALKWTGSWLILQYTPLRLALTPKHIKLQRVRARALGLFRVGTEAKTVGRTGVLLYLSMKEHRAEIVADEAIALKVSPEIWGDAMVALLEEVREGRVGAGMAEAVRQMGIVLAEHFPKGSENPNELPDRLIEL